MIDIEKNLTELQRQRNEQQRREIQKLMAQQHRQRVVECLDWWKQKGDRNGS